ncbi:MAG: hypothetical protein PVJ68_19010 [Candidatus Thiodiazotropha sp.]|jgi:hypothetical protein
MRNMTPLLVPLIALATPGAMAHTGPEALDRHFIEHLAIALIIGLPAIYGLLRMAARSDRKEP